MNQLDVQRWSDVVVAMLPQLGWSPELPEHRSPDACERVVAQAVDHPDVVPDALLGPKAFEVEVPGGQVLVKIAPVVELAHARTAETELK